MTDPQSPEQYRVNGVVRNMDAWYKTTGKRMGCIKRFAMGNFFFDIDADNFRCELAGNCTREYG